jgi:hypothetical protein
MSKMYTVKIISKNVQMLAKECFTTFEEADVHGERLIGQFHKAMNMTYNPDTVKPEDVFLIDVQEHTVIQGGTPNMVPLKTPAKTL